MSISSLLQNGIASQAGHTQLTPFGAAEAAKSGNPQIESAIKSSTGLQDAFWEYSEIKRSHWNQNFPYRFAVYQRSIDTNGKTTWKLGNKIPPFTLPISPESLTISTPFAVTTSVTLGGIVEEHNGAPIRIISIMGSTGVLPLRGNVNAQSLNQQSSIFAGVVGAVQTLQKNAQILGGTLGNPNVLSKSDLSDGADQGTGYYQFLLLERWFEAYVALKKTVAGRDSILALELWKDDQIYLCSPMNFERRRTAASALEYNYTIQLKAWKRVNPVGSGPDAFNYSPIARDPNRLFEALNALNKGRQLLQDVKNVLRGVRADINQVLFTPLRQGILFIKDAIGVVTVATDLPANIISDLKEPLLEIATLDGNSLQTNFDAIPKKIEEAFKSLSIQLSKAEAGSGRVQDGLTGAAPAHKVAANPDDNFNFFNSIRPGDLNLRPETKKKIEDEKKEVRKLKRKDFEKARDGIASVLTDFESAVGASNSTYGRIYGIPTRPSTRVPTESDYEVIFALNEVIIQFNKLAASSTINRDEISSIDYFAGLAERSGIAFTVPRSKFLVPFLYGHTLEQISNLYLGTPDRWHEIASLNGLQSPYVDELGFTLPLLTNGNGNTVTVGDASNLYVNQSVWIGSVTVARTQRRITKIDKLSPTLNIITVSGEQDLAQYTVASTAVMQAFLPNTVNSQMSLYIPSDEDVDEADFRQKSIPGVDYFDPLVRAGGIDILLSPTGDIVVTPDGDTRLAIGLTNIVQKVRLVLDTPRGTLLHHPDYGFPLQPGMSTADLSAQDILNLSKDLFKDDPTFSGVESAAILKSGSVVKISLSVGIAGTQKVIPITVEIPR